MELYYDVFPTGLGWFAVLASSRGVRYTRLRPSPQEALDDLGPEMGPARAAPERFGEVKDAVEAFLSGREERLGQIKLDLDGAPPFHQAAWKACRSIPLGETRSYAWLAAQAGSPGANRAAGQAMARNRVPFMVPCHRVIGSDGGLHGYGSGGLEVKARLLNIEVDLQARAETAA